MSTNPNDGVRYEEHWHTWSVNHGYYGEVDTTRTRWSTEWGDKPLAEEIWRRRDAITAAVEQHEPVTRCARLRIERGSNGRLWVTEYDYRRWTAVIEPEGQP
jgi:hypothetical protein